MTARSHGSVTLTCLGCLGILLALLALSLLKGCVKGPGSATLPPGDDRLEFSVHKDHMLVEVSRPLGMARLQAPGGRCAILALERQESSGWLLREQDHSYVRIDPARARAVGGSQEGLGTRLRQIWSSCGSTSSISNAPAAANTRPETTLKLSKNCKGWRVNYLRACPSDG